LSAWALEMADCGEQPAINIGSSAANNARRTKGTLCIRISLKKLWPEPGRHG
jgi:hypothetical protein